MAKLNTLQLGDKIYDSFPDKEARQLIETQSTEIKSVSDKADSASSSANLAKNNATRAMQSAEAAQLEAVQAKNSIAEINSKIAELEGNIGTGGAAIIDVIELPDDDIDEKSFYRLLTATFVDGGVLANNYSCTVVETLPDTGEPVTTQDMATINAYYNIANNTVYGYIDDTLSQITDVPRDWYDFDWLSAVFGVKWGGIITSMNDALDNKAIYLLLETTIYAHDGRWTALKSDRGTNTLIVTFYGDSHASHSGAQICEHLRNGGTAMLYNVCNGYTYSLSWYGDDVVFFSASYDDGYCDIVAVSSDACLYENHIPTPDEWFGVLGSLETITTKLDNTTDLVDDFNADIASNMHKIDELEQHADYVDVTIGNIKTQIGTIDKALGKILVIQQSLIDSALQQAEGVEF